MQSKILTPQDVKALAGALMQQQTVVAPVRQEGFYAHAVLTRVDDLAIPPGGLPRVSAKQALLPRSEVLFYYKVGKATEKTVPPPPPRPQVLFGVHPCDVQAIKVLDAVFGAQPYPDELYLARRRATTIVGLGVPGAAPANSFFEQLGISSMDNRDCDLFLTELAPGRFLLEVLTDKGATWAPLLSGLPDAAPADTQRLQALRDEAAGRVTHTFDARALSDKLKGMFKSALWDKMGERCLGCGACAYLCPTCHCFDIQDERRGDVGCRVRNWDTCQFDLFTKHASGHNPRRVQSGRARQRILHKFEYGYSNFAIPFCIGCGRCLDVCPAGNSLLEALKEIAEAPEPDAAQAKH